MTTQEIKIGTKFIGKGYEMVVYSIESDGVNVRVFSGNGRQTGVRFVCNHEFKYFDIKN